MKRLFSADARFCINKMNLSLSKNLDLNRGVGNTAQFLLQADIDTNN